MLTLQHFLLPLLFLTGLLAGTIDAIAGGGGLITLPILLFVGLPPHAALGTSKLQSSVGTGMAAKSYYQHGWFSFELILKGLLLGVLGAVLGAILGQVVHNEVLRKLIPFLLFIILIYTIFSPRLGETDTPPKMNEALFYQLFGFALGFYDAFFGPGTGSLWVFALTFFLGYNLTKATAYTKVFNLKSNIIGIICFALGQNINYKIALVMAAGQLIGGRLGAHLAMMKGALIIRPVFLLMVSGTIAALFYQNSYLLSVNHAKIIFLTATLFLLLLFYLSSHLRKKSISPS